MRVWQCNEDDYDNIIVDPFYEKGYMCNANDIETVDINTFLNSVVQNHSEYKNNYVKIKGKISKKSGINSIEMRPYTETENKVNGYVEFANNITARVIFSFPPLVSSHILTPVKNGSDSGASQSKVMDFPFGSSRA